MKWLGLVLISIIWCVLLLSMVECGMVRIGLVFGFFSIIVLYSLGCRLLVGLGRVMCIFMVCVIVLMMGCMKVILFLVIWFGRVMVLKWVVWLGWIFVVCVVGILVIIYIFDRFVRCRMVLLGLKCVFWIIGFLIMIVFVGVVSIRFVLFICVLLIF